MAEYFWEEGNDQVSAALTAAKLYKRMADKRTHDDETKQRLLSNKR